ncbi:MAG: cold shock and DUF1294 domain-containing protein [Pseudomonadota bacterium]
MRFQGRITTWKDDQGFGFITPNGGGDQVFVHIKSFSHRQRRPSGNEIVTYEVSTDEQRRMKARNVAFITSRARAAAPGNHRVSSLVLAFLFLTFIIGLVFVGKLPLTLLGLYLGSSMVTFIVYALDKSAARSGRWRTQESTLHLLSLIGGWPGALIAQQHLRHKSKKMSFQFGFWITVALNGVALGWVLTDKGADALRSFMFMAK